MSYAQAAQKGPKQSPEEAYVQVFLENQMPNTDMPNGSRAPAPPSLTSSSSSFTDVDSQHLKSEASETTDQAKEKTFEAADKTKKKSSEAAETTKEKSSDYAQTAKEKAREAADYTKEKSSEFADSASKNYDSAKKSAEKNAKDAKKEIKSAGQDLNENRDNPVVIANGVLIVAGSAALGYGAYTKHVKGELDWQIAAIAAGVVGVLAVGDYYLSQYLFKNKYPKK
ncbi:MAG: hypothetical protein ALECFALPRED_001602 [Alectoria fallacina]|uniref:Mitochondrial outer membrane protein OM14 C-terminal domain-containing protein n=1 Tax=Alectoria fallacina TaxID=1903189 RepID=A0A8H3FBS2_9LECA|nr:MAG: hypothetical protein ALECFALPRED_001602 [Alectoria fallacina]